MIKYHLKLRHACKIRFGKNGGIEIGEEINVFDSLGNVLKNWSSELQSKFKTGK